MTALSSTDSLAEPYSDPIQTGIVTISTHSINTVDRAGPINVSVIQNHPNVLNSPSSAVPYTNPIPSARRATLPSRPSNFHSFQSRQLSSSAAHSIPSLETSPVELPDTGGGMSVTAKEDVMPYAFSSIATLNALRQECIDVPAKYAEPTSMVHDHGRPIAALPYSEPSRFTLDRIPVETPPGLPYAEPNTCSATVHDGQREAALPYQDPVSTVHVNRHAAKQQSMEQLPNPYMEPCPTHGHGQKHGVQEGHGLAMDLFSALSSPKVPHECNLQGMSFWNSNFKSKHLWKVPYAKHFSSTGSESTKEFSQGTQTAETTFHGSSLSIYGSQAIHCNKAYAFGLCKCN